ncbi:S41 family peptidase [Azospirillum halopraeferens]|uniref:S41 family peptidase n=1 Tax=Azospirillum halopraeferens TaxID=34010 RepID=UPI0004284D04|nr:S41 family peptidase [Azospirillum halopraeferens]
MKATILPLALALLIASPAAAQPAPPACPCPSSVRGAEEVDPQALQLFIDTLKRVRGSAVDRRSDRDLAEAAARGMLQSLDRHSTYLDPGAVERSRSTMNGAFAGIGIQLAMPAGRLTVAAPMPESPAARAGILAGDRILAADGAALAGLSVEQAVERLRGAPGTPVTLRLERDGKAFNVTLERAVIRTRPVTWETDRGIGYVRIALFNRDTRAELGRAMAALDGTVAGYVIDLRDNPGGLLDQAVRVADAFLESGTITTIRGRDSAVLQRFTASRGDLAGGRPMAVLINGASASASELVAGALQDHGRAVVVGTRSFGKGTVQSTAAVNGGGAIKMTTGRYHTPGDRAVDRVGIAPDVVVEQPRRAGGRTDTAADNQRRHAVDLILSRAGKRPA